MNKEYIIGTACPSCNHAFDEQCMGKEGVKCVFCGYEIPYRSPLRKKREAMILKDLTESLRSFMMMSFWAFATTLLPLILYVAFSDRTLGVLFGEHPILMSIYAFFTVFVYILYPLTWTLSLGLFNKVRSHGYDIEWIRAYYAKHKIVAKMFKIQFWEDPLKEHEDSL